MAVMVVDETTVNERAAIPPKLTAVALLKLLPVMVTTSPWPAVDGEIAEINGTGITMVGMNVKPGNVAAPLGVVTNTLPELPVPTTAVIVVGETTVNDAAVIPPKPTVDALVKLVPVMVTISPVWAAAGEMLVITGAGGINVNPANVTVPPGAVTDTSPEAPVARVAVIVVAFTIVKEVAAVPPKYTLVAPVKFVPVMVIKSPAAPEVGVNEVMVGTGGNQVNPAKVAVPPSVLTRTSPVAPIPTVASMVVGETMVL
jgi:hypothetical protein